MVFFAVWVGIRRFFGILGLTSNWQFMLATISGGVAASLLTKFMFLYDDTTRFYGKNLAQFIRQGAPVDGETKPLLTPQSARFHELGTMTRIRASREHI